MTSVFTRILHGELPASWVHRDEVVFAIMDLHPINPGHTLIIPNEEISSFAELPPDTAAHMFKVAQRIATAIRGSALR